MNLVLISEEDFIGPGRVRIEGRRFFHIVDVHRAVAGTELCVGLADGCIGTGVITSITGVSVEMDVRLDQKPPQPLPITVVLALPRPKVLRRTLAALSSLGVKRLYLINAYRVEKSYWKSPFLKKDEINRQLALGLEQARDTIMPEVLMRPLFKPFVEDELPAVMQNTIAIAAHPYASTPCPNISGRPATLVIGPEGGFIPYEIEKLHEAGFIPVTFGERILRIETALPYIIARLQ